MQIFLIITAVIFAAACGILSVLCLSQRRRLHAQSLRIGEEEARTAAETARSTELAGELRARELDLVAARKDIEALTARLDEEGEKLKEKNEMLMLQFEKTANDIFERKTRQFKDVNKESLDIILKPLKDNISDFKQRVEEIYSKENENRGALKAELNSLMELNRRITAETTNLTNALKGNSKVQGDWGEMLLETILDNSNLIRGVHYDCQVTIKDDEGNNQRPDVVLYLPEGKRIVIDSKVSLTAYVEWVGAEEEAARTRYLAAHVASVRQHVNELSRKEYQRLLESPDFVIMFIPNEPAFLAAMQHDSAIWSDAYERKVIISSPTNLFALLKLVDDLWRRNEQSRNQEQIIKYGTTLYEQFVAFAASLEGVGQALDLARAKYDDAYKRLHTGNNNIVRTGERLRRLGLPTAKRPSRRLLDETDGLDAEEELPAAGDGGHDRQ